MFAGISCEELKDPHNPPQHAKGPFTIDGNNRFIWLGLIGFRRVICLEIIRGKEHTLPGLFRDFPMWCTATRNPTTQLRFCCELLSLLESSHHYIWYFRKRAAANHIKMHDWQKL